MATIGSRNMYRIKTSLVPWLDIKLLCRRQLHGMCVKLMAFYCSLCRHFSHLQRQIAVQCTPVRRGPHSHEGSDVLLQSQKSASLGDQRRLQTVTA